MPLEYRWDFGNDVTRDTEWSSSPNAVHTWDDDYTGEIKLEVRDKLYHLITDDDTATVTVNNVAPKVEAGNDKMINEGDTFIGSGSFTDPGADAWTATVDYGDASGLQTLALNPDKTFSLSHTYGDNGTYNVTVMVEDDDKGKGSDEATVTVNNLAPTVTIDSVTCPVDGCILPGQEVSFAGSFTDPGWQDTHKSSWNFGDENEAPGSLTEENDPPDATGKVSAKHTYSEPGTFAVILEIKDDDGGIGTAKKDVKVMTNSEAIDFADNYIQNVEETCFKGQAEQRKGAFSEKFEAVKNAIAADALVGAISKLQNDIRSKADGSVDGKPKDDWITDEKSQKKLCLMIDELVKYLESLQDKKKKPVVVKDDSKDKDKGKDDTNAAPALSGEFEFAAFTAYPQPCNPEVWIPYALGEGVEVSITIYDAAGRLIRIMNLGYQNAGAYISKDRSAHWDGDNQAGEPVSSGVYFYNVQAGEFTVTRKIVVAR
jgi:hypothetical protein